MKVQGIESTFFLLDLPLGWILNIDTYLSLQTVLVTEPLVTPGGKIHNIHDIL